MYSILFVHSETANTLVEIQTDCRLHIKLDRSGTSTSAPMGQAETRLPCSPSHFGPDEDGWVFTAEGDRCFQLPAMDPMVRDLQQLTDLELDQMGQQLQVGDGWEGYDGFLSHWMGSMMPVIGHKTLWELCLPGSHDALTYDLSNTPATGDTIPSLGLLERDEFPFRNIRKKISEELIVKLSKCQMISVRQQLQGGIR